MGDKKNPRYEYPDSRPVAASVGGPRSMTLQEQIARIMRSEEFRRATANQGFDTPEEADDFDVPDDPSPFDPNTPYEMHFDYRLGREALPAEIAALDAAEKEFDYEYREYRNRSQLVSPARQKKKKASPPPTDDDSSDDE